MTEWINHTNKNMCNFFFVKIQTILNLLIIQEKSRTMKSKGSDPWLFLLFSLVVSNKSSENE